MAKPAPDICPAPRISWACDLCRKKRQRCLPSEKAGICERCLSIGSKCMYTHRDDQRKKIAARKAATSQPALPLDVGIPRSQHAPATDLLKDLFPTGKRPTTEAVLDSFRSAHEDMIGRMLDPGQASADTNSRNSMTGIYTHDVSVQASDAVDNQPFDRAKIEESLRQYEKTLPQFPFFALPTDPDIDRLRIQHPFLLLAVLFAANRHDYHARMRLDSDLRRVFNQKVVEEGERSIDLIQGTLLWIACFPMEKHPRARQIFQNLRLACDMVQDMELEKLFGNAETAYDASRTYLACYYMASLTPTAWPNERRKTFMLPFSDVVEQALCVLASTGSDADHYRISVLVKAQRLIERADAISSPTQLLQEAAILQGEIAAISAQLRHLSIGVESDKTMQLCIHYAEAVLHSSDLRHKAGYFSDYTKDFDLLPGFVEAEQWRTANLTQCLKASRAFLDIFASLPTKEYEYFTFAEWARFIRILVMLCRLSFPLDVISWDDMTARADIRLRIYLESLCYRMQELSRQKDADLGAQHPSLFLLIHSALQIVKEGYERKVSEREKELDAAIAGIPQTWDLHCPVLSKDFEDSQYWNLLQDNSDWQLFGSTSGTGSTSTGEALPSESFGTPEDWTSEASRECPFNV